VLHDAARQGALATTGPYARVRHPQYDGFLLIMIGFLLQWPTIPTLVMFPILAIVYTRLARSEEREVAASLRGSRRHVRLGWRSNRRRADRRPADPGSTVWVGAGFVPCGEASGTTVRCGVV
jgi:hypothetical protein